MGEIGRIDVAVVDRLIDVAAGLEFVSDRRAGGIATFAGVTRGVTDGVETTKLSYEAYTDMATTTMNQLAEQATRKWDICRIWMHHRVGTVPVGEASVVIAVSAPHRPAAFEACRFLIDELKDIVPIWKKEHFSDGSSEWVEGT